MSWTKRADGVFESDDGETVDPRDDYLAHAFGVIAHKLLFEEKLSSQEETLRNWWRNHAEAALRVINGPRGGH